MSAVPRLEIGRIGKAHGLRGEVVLEAISNRDERFRPGSVLFLADEARTIESARRHQNRWLVRFDGVDDRNAAEALRGIVVTGDPLDSDDSDEVWVHELVGSVVVDRAGRELGVIVAVEANPAHDILVLDGGVLIPIVFMVEQQPERVVVELPDGLLELYRVSAMRIDVFSAFPEYFETPLRVSLLGRARERALVDLRVHDLREYATDRHRSLDDSPFGGGAGMVMLPEPLFAAVEAIEPPRPLLLLSAAGAPFDQARASALAAGAGFSLLCGRYEGVDQRVADHLADGELSIGDYVTAGGEAAALVVIEAVTRLVPGVMGNAESGEDESHVGGLLEYPQYTRPAEFRGWSVPEVVRSGDHARVARWRRAQALHRTRQRRPDLLESRGLSDADRAAVAEFPDAGVGDAAGPDLPGADQSG